MSTTRSQLYGHIRQVDCGVCQGIGMGSEIQTIPKGFDSPSPKILFAIKKRLFSTDLKCQQCFKKKLQGKLNNLTQKFFGQPPLLAGLYAWAQNIKQISQELHSKVRPRPPKLSNKQFTKKKVFCSTFLILYTGLPRRRKSQLDGTIDFP